MNRCFKNESTLKNKKENEKCAIVCIFILFWGCLIVGQGISYNELLNVDICD